MKDAIGAAVALAAFYAACAGVYSVIAWLGR